MPLTLCRNRLNRPIDLAGYRVDRPHYLQTRARIVRLLDRYVTIDLLSDRLSDLPAQFSQPQPRPWEPIDWKGLDRSQIIGIDPELFLKVLAGATEIEAPIREYSRESREYLQRVHPKMAFFVGGDYREDGTTAAVGVWEKEERQHAPTFSKIYQQLTGQKLLPKPNSVADCHFTSDPWIDLHQHVTSRITTEWSAAAVYLWLMAHSTGALQQAIAQPFQDEINHLAKFWGFSRWAFSDSYFQQVIASVRNLVALLKHHKGERTSGKDLASRTHRFKNVTLAVELSFTLVRVMARLRLWNRELCSDHRKVVADPPSVPSECNFCPP